MGITLSYSPCARHERSSGISANAAGNTLADDLGGGVFKKRLNKNMHPPRWLGPALVRDGWRVASPLPGRSTGASAQPPF